MGTEANRRSESARLMIVGEGGARKSGTISGALVSFLIGGVESAKETAEEGAAELRGRRIKVRLNGFSSFGVAMKRLAIKRFLSLSLSLAFL